VARLLILRHLDLAGCVRVSSESIKAIASTCEALESLDLSDCLAIDDSAVKEISLRCRRMHTLYLARLPLLTDIACQSIYERPRRSSTPWQCLSLSGCERITSRGILAAIARDKVPSAITSLDLSHMRQVSDLALLGAKLPALTSLDLRGLAIRDEGLAWAGAGTGPALRELRLDGCLSVTAIGIAAIADSCSDLESISLRRCYGLGDDALHALHQGLSSRRLRSVHLDYLRDIHAPALRTFFASFPELLEVSLIEVHKLDDTAVEILARTAGPRLRRLRVTEDHRDGDGAARGGGSGTRLRDVALRALGKHCPDLEELTCAGMRHSTDKGVEALLRGCSRLLCLSLGGAP